MAASEWLKDLQRAAQETAQREQRGEQLTLGDLERTPDKPRTKPVQETAAPTAEPRPNRGGITHAAQGATERVRRSFTAPTDPARGYRAMYAALFRFHERHNPPTLGDDDGALYWAAVSDDMQATAQQFNNDPFMVDLLCIVFEELEREYKALRNQAAGA